MQLIQGLNRAVTTNATGFFVVARLQYSGRGKSLIRGRQALLF